MNFSDVLLRAGDDGLQELLGSSTVRLLNNLDSDLARASSMRKIFEELYSPVEVLRNSPLRKIFFTMLKEYLNKGKFIITLRQNVLFFIKRKYMTFIAPLGITYGLYKNKNDDYWFNAENQLRQICIENDVDIFDSCTTLEEDSLYKYHENNYYKDGELIKNNNFFFFIKRR
jgi:hypothetical protein